MIRALVGAMLVGVVCPLLGTLVILKRMAFFADAVAHFALPGLLIALIAGWPVGSFLVGFSMLAALAMGWVKQRTEGSADMVLGVFSAVAIALGGILMGLGPGYQGQILSFLFGDILALSWGDLVVLGGLGLAVVVFVGVTFQAQLLINFQPDLAQVQGVRVGLLETVFILLLAGVVATVMKFVGALLVTAFLVIPAAVARQGATSYRAMFILAPGIGVGSAIVGLVLAALGNVPAGPMIVLVQGVLFLGVVVWGGGKPKLGS